MVAPVSGAAAAGQTDGSAVQTVSVTDNISVWDRAVLPLRTDPGGPTQVAGPSLFVNAPQQNTGDVPMNKPVLSVSDAGEPISMQFQSSLGAGTQSFAGDDAQLVAVHLENESSMQRFTGGLAVDELRNLAESGSENASVTVLDDADGVTAIDENGELNASYAPEESGGYLFVLATVEDGAGFVSEGDQFRADGDVTVVGTDATLVQDTSSEVTPDAKRAAPGDDLTFQVESNLDADAVTHGIVVYRKAELVNQRATATVETGLDRDVSADQLSVETSLDRVEGTSNVGDGTALLGSDLADDRVGLPMTLDGLFDVVATASQQGQGQEDALHASTTVVEGGADGTVTVETGAEWPNGNYRFVHVATAENGSQISTADGRVTLSPGAERGNSGQGQGNSGQSPGNSGQSQGK